ncbi:hypothetical protein [Rheinheimera texasensis]|uniref:hypothetical protein n=1 Tax=Rheinheimera texasensis TaxID=306205 RepID=UPI0032B19565
MKIVKIALISMAVFAATHTTAQQAAADIATLYAQAQTEGLSMGGFVAKMTELKTCNPKLAEQVIDYALEQAGNDPVLVEEVLKSVNNQCIDQDTLTTLAIAANIDPTLITNALQTAAAAGSATAAPAPAIAATPGGVGAGGGTGTGDTSLASGS